MRLMSLLLLLLAATGAGAASVYTDKTFRFTGDWDGQFLHAVRTQLREPIEDSNRGQIGARLYYFDAAKHRFRLGPQAVAWDSSTQFEDMTVEQLANGLPVRVSGRLDHGLFKARVVRPLDDIGEDQLQVTGAVTAVSEQPDGSRQLLVLGIPVHMLQPGYNAVESLTRRQDSRQPEIASERKLWGMPFGTSGQFESQVRDRSNHDLAGANRRLDVETGLQLEALLRIDERSSLFLSGQAVAAGDLLRASGRRSVSFSAERDQMWLYFDRLWGSGVGLQIGRQNFKEPREWWWDDDLDAIRAYYDRGGFHAELGVARELAKVSSADPGIDPLDDGITRVLGTASWLWAPRQRIDLFFLSAADRSRTEAVGSEVLSDLADKSDAGLRWYGVRVSGNRDVGRFGTLGYWIDTAWVNGHERLLSFDDVADVPDRSVVTRERSQQVRGSALDAGLSWKLPLPGSPSLTLGIASGSGDGDDADGVDHGFRQTGLHNNKYRYFGVNRFRAYGEVLRPELSNLTITTASVGLPLLQNSSAELSYHRYKQRNASDSLRDVRIDADLNGISTDVGQALDFVVGFREGRSLDVTLTFGLFRAGEAYGDHAGKIARIYMLETTWNF